MRSGDAPHVDLLTEHQNGTFLRDNRKSFRAANDISDGGLALASFKMAQTSGIGFELDSQDIGQLFGEDQARYVLACSDSQAQTLAAAAIFDKVPLMIVGRFGGDEVRLGNDVASLSELTAIYNQSFAKAVNG
jgi:phosphoribosylformylglycinamidine (FGAM) synthase-like enzyme